MLRTLLIFGLLAGLCGGLVATGVARVVGEPPLDRAIAWEEAHAAAPGRDGDAHDHDHAIVSRSVQSGVGLLAGAAIYGTALGGLFALAFAAAYGRVSRVGPARTALALGLCAFVVLYLVPFLKYPANPPAVGHPDTIGERTALYLGMVAISALAALAALRLRRDLAARVRADVALLGAVATYLTVVIAGAAIMPAVDEVPAAFPATTLWDFRVASVAVQLAMWSVITLGFAVAAERRIAGVRTVRLPDGARLRSRG
jgi:predicted cobalt transporter CbtA